MCADLSEWLNGKLYHDDYPDVDSFANYILSCDGDNNIYFSSFLNDHDSIVSEILLLWHEDFENGNDLPDYALKTLKNYPLLHTTTNKTARNDIKNHIKKLKSFLLFKKNVYQGTNNQNVQKKLKSQLIKYKRDYPWAFLMLEESNFEDIEQMKIKGSNQREALKYKISSHIVCQCEGFISDSDQEKVVDEILSDCFPPYRARLLTS